MEDSTGGYMTPGVAEVYDALYGARPELQQGVELYLEEAKASGGPVLELGCGTGRVLIPIARAGIEITGLDLSADMLTVLRRKLEKEPEEVRKRVRIVHADMRGFDLRRKFALVIVPFRPFQHVVEVEGQLSCLRAIRRHLRQGGRVVFDLFFPNLQRISEPPILEEKEDFGWTDISDGSQVRRTLRQPVKDLGNQVLHCELIYYRRWPDGREERNVQAFPFRYFFRFEVEHLLARAGFRVLELYSDFDRARFGEGYPKQMIFVAAPE